MRIDVCVVSPEQRNSLWPNIQATLASLPQCRRRESCIGFSISMLVYSTHKVDTRSPPHISSLEADLCSRCQKCYFTTCQVGFYSNSPPKKKAQMFTVEMAKSSEVKLCALTFTRGKLDVTLHSVQNIQLSQNVAATSSVSRPTD